MPDRTPTHRYRSPTYSRSGAAARRRRGRRRLAALLATLVLLAVGGLTAWALVGDRQAGTTAADTTSGAGQDGDGPDTAAIVEPVASPSPSPDTAESAGSSGSAGSPAPSPDGSAGTFGGTYVPILMYHRIEETTDTSTNAKYYTSPKKFRQQMRALYLEGYTAVTLQQVWDYWHDEGTLPAKPIVLTFDDGTSGQAENTLPVLEKYGWPGVISVVVPNVTDAGGSLSISPDQIRRLLDAGWELDSHSMTHPMLNTASADRLAYELGESRRRLQEQFGVPCNFFCYPGGEHNATVMAAAEAAGYLGATTVVRGCADPATRTPSTASRSTAVTSSRPSCATWSTGKRTPDRPWSASRPAASPCRTARRWRHPRNPLAPPPAARSYRSPATPPRTPPGVAAPPSRGYTSDLAGTVRRPSVGV